jgi:hypothetical protein
MHVLDRPKRKYLAAFVFIQKSNLLPTISLFTDFSAVNNVECINKHGLTASFLRIPTS